MPDFSSVYWADWDVHSEGFGNTALAVRPRPLTTLPGNVYEVVFTFKMEIQSWLLLFLETCSERGCYCFTAKSVNYTLFISIFTCFLLFSCILNVGVGQQCYRLHRITSHSLCLFGGGQELAHKNGLLDTSRCPIIPQNLMCRCYPEMGDGDG